MNRNFSFVLFFIMLFSSLYMTFSIARFITIFFALLILLYFIILKKDILFYKPIPTLLILIVTFSSIISAIKNTDPDLFFGGISLFLLYILLSIFLPNLYQEKLLPNIKNSILFSHILLLLISLFITKNIDYPFAGMFSNPNSMGILLTTINVVLISSLWQRIYNKIFHKKKVNFITFLFILIIILITFYLTVKTGSRTSTLITVAILLLPFPFVSFLLIKRKGFLKSVAFTILLTVITLFLWLIVKLTPLYSALVEIFYYKFLLKFETSSITSGRNEIWSEVLSKSSLFGEGRDFFGDEIGIAGHNTFISLLGQYGYITSISFLLFCITVLIISYNYLLENKNIEHRFLPFLLTMSFLLFSLTESMMYKTPMIALFIFSGLKGVKEKSTSESL